MSTPIRKRTTWAADRNASAPPATPGYGTEDQDHPAHQPDPAQAAYAKGTRRAILRPLPATMLRTRIIRPMRIQPATRRTPAV